MSVIQIIVFCSQPGKLFIKTSTKVDMNVALAKGSIRERSGDKMDEMACGSAENEDSKSEVHLEVYDADDI